MSCFQGESFKAKNQMDIDSLLNPSIETQTMVEVSDEEYTKL